MACFNAHRAFAPAVLALCLCAAACGSSRVATTRPSSKPASVPPSSSITGDYDGDDDNKHISDADNDDSNQPKDRDNDSERTRSYFDGDDESVRGSAHAAGVADRRAIVRLIERYFAAAARADGAIACPMVSLSLARSVPETLGGPAGPPFARGKTCAEVMTSVFAHYHRQLAAHAPSLKVASVWVGSGMGVAVLAFATLPGRQMTVSRTKSGWKIDTLLDTELP